MPLSSDPAKRANQLANLRPENSTKHSGRSEVLIQPLAERYFAELLGEFPSASERVLRLQARRLAKLERIGAFLEQKGEISHQRRGEVFPAALIEESTTSAFLATQAKLEAQAREARKSGAAPAALAGELEASRTAWEYHVDGEGAG